MSSTSDLITAKSASDASTTLYTASLEEDEEGSINQLVQYSQEHDAVLAFYYTDDNNRTQVCEIFDIENPRRVSTCHSTACNKSPVRNLPSLIPENDDEFEIYPITSPAPAEDSGLSLTEDNSVPLNPK